MTPTPVTVEATVNTPADKVWSAWNEPEHVMKWNHASDDWHCPAATSDLREGGTFSATMAAKDGSFSFDFGGTYTKVVPNTELAYVMSDGRKVSVSFSETNGGVHVVETFDAESENPIEMQRDGWQAILNNFKQYAESL